MVTVLKTDRINSQNNNEPDCPAHNAEILKYFNNVSWNQSIKKIHSENIETLHNSDYLKRLIFDEIISNFLICLLYTSPSPRDS